MGHYTIDEQALGGLIGRTVSRGYFESLRIHEDSYAFGAGEGGTVLTASRALRRYRYLCLKITQLEAVTNMHRGQHTAQCYSLNVLDAPYPSPPGQGLCRPKE